MHPLHLWTLVNRVQGCLVHSLAKFKMASVVSFLFLKKFHVF